MISQILRSGTSVGANIHEAQHAQGKPDFIPKPKIALKEANEAEYRMELLFKTGYIKELSVNLCDKNVEQFEER